jgi:Uma2 family endonuclease
MSSLPKTFVTPEEYLEYDRKSEERYEYYNGEMFAMSGGSRRHSLIGSNVIIELGRQLKGRSCEIHAGNLRLRISTTGLYAYPDVMVVCGEARFADNQKDTLLNPVLIVEVRSPSTSDYDRGKKFEDYRTLTSVQEYLTVAQDVRFIEHWTRQPDDRWLLTEFKDPAQTIQLASIGCTLPLSEVYDKIEFTPGS